jgi:hypothetical protein
MALRTDYNREGLYAALDDFLAAFAQGDASRLKWSPDARISENGVLLSPGQGAWISITGLGDYDFRLCDISSGGVAMFGVLEESGDRSPFGVRLQIDGDRIAEAELVVARPLDCGTPFLNADLEPRPELTTPPPPEGRTPRERMIELADGYFSTLERNDGTIHTDFDPLCDRRENGAYTTNSNNEHLGWIATLGCEEQFRLGWYRFDDELRARRYPLVDEERGLVLSGAMIDHAGLHKTVTLTDGRVVTPVFRRPHSFNLMEIFKINAGRIEAIEAVFHTVPYRMPSPWDVTG